MLVARFLDGLAGSAFLSVAGGTVGDMFAKHVRASAVPSELVTNTTTGTFCPNDGLYSSAICRVIIVPHVSLYRANVEKA